MGLFSWLFGSNKTEQKETSKEKVTILNEETIEEDGITITTKTIVSTVPDSPREIEYDRLMKLSTSLKKEKKFNEAIECIYEASKIFSKKPDTSELFKIAYYHQLNKEFDKSWDILQTVLDKIKPTDDECYYMEIADVFKKQAEHLKREKNLKEYLYQHSQSFYMNLIKGMLYPAVWSPMRYYEDENLLREEFNIKPLRNDELREEYIQFHIDFYNSKKNDIVKLYEYLHYFYENPYSEDFSQKNERDPKVVKELLQPLHFLELSNQYNEKLSDKLVDVKWNKK